LLQTSNYIIFIKIPDSEDYLLIQGYTGAMDRVNKNVVQFLRERSCLDENERTNGIDVSQATIDALIKRGYLTNRSQSQECDHVRQLAKRIHYFQNNKSRSLFLISYDCNFRCPYCFENGISSHGKAWSKAVMTNEMADKAYQTMVEIQPDRTKHENDITLYGGEPLLSQNYDIISYIVEEGRKKNYTFTAITNGYELHRYTELLKPGLIQSLQITLDGPPNEHNIRRMHYQDGPTFDRIMENIDVALHAGVSVQIRVNIDSNNAATLPALSRIFLQNGWTHMENFFAYSAPVHGGDDAIVCSSIMSDSKKKSSQVAAMNACENYTRECNDELSLADSSYSKCNNRELLYSTIHTRHSDNSSQNNTSDGLPVNKHSDHSAIASQDFELKSRIIKTLAGAGWTTFRTTYCGAGTGMMIFDPYGDLYACWEVVGMGEYKIGTYRHQLELNRIELDKWRTRNITTVLSCSRCQYALFCGGGCEASLLFAGREPNTPSCNSFQSKFKTLAIEALHEVEK
jgi:uncharacterized protein